MKQSAHSNIIYLDANATTPVLEPIAAEVMNTMMVEFGNPSSAHISGVRAKRLLEQTRLLARQLIGTKDGELLFTSGATEGIQTAVVSVLRDYLSNGGLSYKSPVLLYGATEHKAVPNTLHHWNKVMGLNAQILEIPVDKYGILDLKFISEHVGQAVMICTMAVNNETGVKQDLLSLEATIRSHNTNVAWLVDCVQGLGKIELNMDSISIDYAPFSGHKLYAPKGIGFLYIRSERPYTPFIAGGGQEAGMRSGTENLPGIAGLKCLFELLLGECDLFKTNEQLVSHRELLISALNDTFRGVSYHNQVELSVPTTINFSVAYLTSKEIMDLFDAAGIRVSGGSACSSGAKSSFVLEAMGLTQWQCENSIRLSFGPADSTEFIERACEAIRQLRAPLLNHCLSGDIANINESVCAKGLTQIEYHGESSWIFVTPDMEVIVYNPIEAVHTKIANIVTNQKLRLSAVLVKDYSDLQLSAKEKLCRLLTSQYLASFELKLASTTCKLITQHYELGPCYTLRLGDEKTMIFTEGNVLDAESFDLLCTSNGAELMTGTSLSKSKFDEVVNIQTLKDAREWLKQNSGVVLDIREPFEHEASVKSVKALFELDTNTNLFNIPMSRLAHAYLNNELDNEVSYLLFCRTGTRSNKAQQVLSKLGVEHIANFEGGLALCE
ncbi:aminotransferase class V-fold PLP-dependent enzyme [Pseudoalteromonas luteoviolacea]|uniref:aminotransferase class V-fold PLP-dependent enzyme n=1 Tax=Pseudoalteromonas luteoviolacea TaxID=43657 RepID=UPI001FD4BC5B|nr:aminotransferase class V-fold PLP-dependent enzyme [Pseudoalteromonas luteoviolacea]